MSYLRESGAACQQSSNSGDREAPLRPAVTTCRSFDRWVSFAGTCFCSSIKWAVSCLTDGPVEQFARFRIEVMAFKPSKFITEKSNYVDNTAVLEGRNDTRKGDDGAENED